MIKKTTNILKTDNNLLKHSSIIFIATVISGVFGYLFQLYVGRALGPEGYGEFSALVSILIITSVPASTIITTVALFTSEYKAKAEYGKIKHLLVYSLNKLFIFGLIGFLLISLASGVIASFLKIPDTIPIFIIGLIFLVSAIYPLTTGALQGLQNFTQAGLNGIIGAAFKLAFSMVFIYIGWGVSGAMLALFVSTLLAFLLALVPLRFILKEASIKIQNRDILQYSLPVFVTSLIITLISNIDVVLVKHYFSATEAGYYSAASLISKVIFFVTAPIATVMFPKVSELHIKKEITINVLKNCLAYTCLLSLIAVIAYWAVPNFVVGMLFGQEYAEAIRIIGIFGIALMFFSLSYILIIYNMAIKNFSFLYITTAILLLEVSLLSIFHESLFTVVKILAILFIMLFIGLGIIAFGKHSPGN